MKELIISKAFKLFCKLLRNSRTFTVVISSVITPEKYALISQASRGRPILGLDNSVIKCTQSVKYWSAWLFLRKVDYSCSYCLRIFFK